MKLTKREITRVKLAGGRVVNAEDMVCRTCESLDLNTTVDTKARPMVATCPNGHSWELPNEN